MGPSRRLLSMLEPNDRPAWMFWWPLAFWKVALVFLVSNVAMQLVCVGLREGLGLAFATTGGAAAGAGVLGVVIVVGLANRQRDAGGGA